MNIAQGSRIVNMGGMNRALPVNVPRSFVRRYGKRKSKKSKRKSKKSKRKSKKRTLYLIKRGNQYLVKNL